MAFEIEHACMDVPTSRLGMSLFKCRAIGRVLGAAIGGDGDVESASTSAAMAPAWLQKSEKVRGDMGALKEKLVKLKE